MLACFVCRLRDIQRISYTAQTFADAKAIDGYGFCLTQHQQATKGLQGGGSLAVQDEVYLVILAAIARFFSFALCSSWQVLT